MHPCLSERSTYMPPRQRFSKQDVIEAAFQVVRKQGWKGFSARTIASELNASTRPIYDYFDSMENIEAEVVKKILAHFIEFLSQERTGDTWLDQALGYVLFASQEKHLFRCINDEKHTPLQKQFSRRHWMKLGDELAGDERFKDIPVESMHKIRAARWIMIHGLSCLISNGWFETPTTEASILSEEMGYTLVALLEKVNNGLYKEFIG